MVHFEFQKIKKTLIIISYERALFINFRALVMERNLSEEQQLAANKVLWRLFESWLRLVLFDRSNLCNYWVSPAKNMVANRQLANPTTQWWW